MIAPRLPIDHAETWYDHALESCALSDFGGLQMKRIDPGLIVIGGLIVAIGVLWATALQVDIPLGQHFSGLPR
jgi:hypothetical protein